MKKVIIVFIILISSYGGFCQTGNIFDSTKVFISFGNIGYLRPFTNPVHAYFPLNTMRNTEWDNLTYNFNFSIYYHKNIGACFLFGLNSFNWISDLQKVDLEADYTGYYIKYWDVKPRDYRVNPMLGAGLVFKKSLGNKFCFTGKLYGVYQNIPFPTSTIYLKKESSNYQKKITYDYDTTRSLLFVSAYPEIALYFLNEKHITMSLSAGLLMMNRSLKMSIKEEDNLGYVRRYPQTYHVNFNAVNLMVGLNFLFSNKD
ncbi:MAG: hypothetical protein NTX03_11155 [Bacteroidetes bacterium]|nr:hypothetical protein [Bacteroidota bacterium]